MNPRVWLKLPGWVKLAILCAATASGDPLDQWSQRYPPVPMVDFNAIAFADGLFIVVGDSGTILTSPNTSDWTQQDSGVASHLYGVAHGDGKFVAVGERGYVLASDDAISWTPYQLGTTLNFRAVTYGNGIFVAVSEGSDTRHFWTSPDGVTWTNRPYHTSASSIYVMSCVTYGDGLFVAGGGPTFYSTNALEWYDAYLTNGSFFPAQSISYNDGLFVAHARYSSAVTRDGRNWTLVGTDFAQDKHAATYGGQHHVWVGEGANFQSSRNGTNWSGSRIPQSSSLRGLTYAQGKFVAVGDFASLFQSADGTNWSQVLPGPGPYYGMSDFKYGAGKYLAFAPYDGLVFVSSNLVQWQSAKPPSALTKATYYHGNFVGVGVGGVISTSEDGLQWNPVPSPVATNLAAIASSLDRLVVVGDGGTALNSADGTNWFVVPTGVTNRLSGIVRGDDRFVAVGPSGTVIWSLDGLSWQKAAPVPFSPPLEDVAFGKCRFVAISGGSIYVSTNGNEWAYAYSGNSLSFYYIGYGNGRFIVGGYNSYPFPNGCLLSSSNGVKWMCHAIPSYRNTGQALFAEGRFAIRFDNLVMQSDPVPEPGMEFLLSARRSTGLQIDSSGFADTCCRLEASPHLGPAAAWQSATHLILNSNGVASWTETAASNFSARFFRAVGVP